MYPLVVQRSVSKQVDTVLIYQQPVRGSQLFAQVGGKLVVRVND